MKTFFAPAATLLIGVVLGFALNWATIRRLRRRVRELREAVKSGREPTKPASGGQKAAPALSGPKARPRETMKRVIWVCLGMGIAWVWCSYILAYLDKPQIAEALSQVAVTEIIGVVLAYSIKSAVENLSKNNRWPDKPEAAREAPDDEGGMG